MQIPPYGTQLSKHRLNIPQWHSGPALLKSLGPWSGSTRASWLVCMRPPLIATSRTQPSPDRLLLSSILQSFWWHAKHTYALDRACSRLSFQSLARCFPMSGPWFYWWKKCIASRSGGWFLMNIFIVLLVFMKHTLRYNVDIPAFSDHD